MAKSNGIDYELRRMYDERDMLETDIDLLNDDLREMERNGFGDGDNEYDIIESEINAKTNELAYLNSCIEDALGENV